MLIKQRLPVFQAVFFSCALICVGASCAYITHSYCGIEREMRNVLLKATIGLSAGWFVFFLCRSFERFFKDWVWLVMAAALAQVAFLSLAYELTYS